MCKCNHGRVNGHYCHECARGLELTVDDLDRRIADLELRRDQFQRQWRQLRDAAFEGRTVPSQAVR